MPPALSDEENGSSSGEEDIPFRGKAENGPVEHEEEEGAEDDEEYVVERIVSHSVDNKGRVLYEVKWQGFEKKSERTWEPEENLAGAQEVLQEYLDSIGGRPQAPTKPGKKRGRKSTAAESESSTPVANIKRAKKESEWTPPPGSWETEVDYVETVEESTDPKTGEKRRYIYLIWVNGKKTQHPLAHVRQKCPQKLIDYFESHLVFTTTSDVANGDRESIKGEEEDI